MQCRYVLLHVWLYQYIIFIISAVEVPVIKNAWTQCTPFGHCILIKTGGVETKHFANRIQGDEYVRDDGCELKIHY